jgi:flagellar hook-basal body complex protein FliE
MLANGYEIEWRKQKMASAVESGIRADLALIRAGAQGLADSLAVAPAAGERAQQATGFAGSMRDALYRVDAQDRAAADKMAEVDSGRSDDLVGAMLASQEASLSFSMLMQVRNKVMGAVEDLIKLPL